jgi:hypothetical protein
VEEHERGRAILLSLIVRDTPKAFWEDARNRARQTYLDIFHEVKAYPNCLPEHRMFKLHQDRFVRMEHLLAKLAEQHGLEYSAKLLVENDHHYVFASSGALAMTQAYVPGIGAMPKAAEFRKKLSAMNEISHRPRLALGDDPKGIFAFREFYGLLAHCPIGKHFTEAEQKLGMIQFCVPSKNCTKWEAQFTIEEIVSSYEAAKPADKAADRSLRWKKRDKAEGQE